jgi:hypothetical protein
MKLPAHRLSIHKNPTDVFFETISYIFFLASSRADRNVAQPGSALLWGSRGRGFKSRRSDRTVFIQRIRPASRRTDLFLLHLSRPTIGERATATASKHVRPAQLASLRRRRLRTKPIQRIAEGVFVLLAKPPQAPEMPLPDQMLHHGAS